MRSKNHVTFPNTTVCRRVYCQPATHSKVLMVIKYKVIKTKLNIRKLTIFTKKYVNQPCSTCFENTKKVDNKLNRMARVFFEKVDDEKLISYLVKKPIKCRKKSRCKRLIRVPVCWSEWVCVCVCEDVYAHRVQVNNEARLKHKTHRPERKRDMLCVKIWGIENFYLIPRFWSKQPRIKRYG